MIHTAHVIRCDGHRYIPKKDDLERCEAKLVLELPERAALSHANQLGWQCEPKIDLCPTCWRKKPEAK